MNIAIYCGSVLGNNPLYAKKTQALAKWMSHEGHDLVYGGSQNGLMGVLAQQLLADNRKIYGVMPHFLAQKERVQVGLTELFYVDTMHERKQKMSDLAAVFIALPGGLGTLEEISEMLSWSRIGQHHKPCIFYNVAGYYDNLIAFLDKMVFEGFLDQTSRNTILFSDSLTEISNFIQNYQASNSHMYDKQEERG